MMDRVEAFLQNNSLQNSDDIDSLIAFASLVRECMDNKQYTAINRMIQNTLQHSCYEAFSWCMGILQEAFEQADCSLENFECILGKSIPDYDAFIERLQVDSRPCNNGVETVYDNNGEVESFYNILMYKTRYPNSYLVSLENFDTKDNDSVQYKLLFFKD